MERFEDMHLYMWDDDNPDTYGRNGYCFIQPGDTFKDGRYVVHQKLGWGSSGTVWLAWDTLNSQFVALKVIMSHLYIASVANAEIVTLKKLSSKDQQNQRCVIKLLDHFEHRARRFSHVCLVFEYWGDSLIKLIKCHGPKGLPLRLVKRIFLDILDGLDYLHTEFSLVHGDIKPEHVCLLPATDPSVGPHKSSISTIHPPKQKSSDEEEETSKIAESCTVSLGQLVLSHDAKSRKTHDDLMVLESINHRCKVIDFGHVASPGKGKFGTIRTLPYRPPEDILADEDGVSTPADLWSFACVCFELATGEYLFSVNHGDGYGRGEYQLALMKQQLDRIPPEMIARATTLKQKWFDHKGRLRNVPTMKRRTIKERLIEDYNFNEKDATELGDFLKWVLKYEPKKRPTAARCRRHQWFNDVRDDRFIPIIKDNGLISEKTKLKNVNVVEDEHCISKRKESRARETSKLKNVDVVEGKHFSCESKENGEHKYQREKWESKKKMVCKGSGCRKKAMMEAAAKNAKLKRCRPHPSEPF